MIVINNARVLQFEPPRCSKPLSVVIEGAQITNVGASAAAESTGAAEGGRPHTEIDAAGGLLMPGLVCAHHHFYSALACALTAEIGPAPEFVSILRRLWWRLDRALTPEILAATAAVSSLEALRCGTTAVIDHHASPSCIDGSLSTLAEGFRSLGLRGILCYETSDRHGLDGMRAGVAENTRFAAELAGVPSGGDRPGEEPLLAAAVGAHAPFTLSDESLAALAEAAASTGGGIHIHVAEDRYDPSHSRLHHGEELITRLERHRLLSPKALLAHGVHLSDEEIERVNAADATLAHACRSNMNNGVGYNRLLERFKRVVIGTDGIGSDMFEEVKFAYFKHRDAGGRLGPAAFARFLGNGNEVLQRYFNRPFGRIEPGYAADVVISDYRAPTPLDEENAAGHLIYGMRSGEVRTAIVNGRVVMQDRRIDAEIDGIYSRAREAARELWKRMHQLSP